ARSSSGNKEPGREAGLFVFLPTDSAEHAGCIDDTGCRKQPTGDQNKFHDLPPSRLQYSFVLCQVAIRFYGPLAGWGVLLSAGSSQSVDADELSDHPLTPKPATQADGGECSCQLGGDESRDARRRDPCKRVGQRAGNGDGGIGKRCRRREPIGRRDVEANGVSNGLRPPRDTAEDGQ